MPTEWALRPVINAARDAEQTGVVWKLMKISPFVARRSGTGVLAGPPNETIWA